VDALGARVQSGLETCLREAGIESVVARQGSAFVTYFMDHSPRDWHDLAAHHDGELDRRFRLAMIEQGIYFFPVATKQCSISAAHTEADIDRTLEAARVALQNAGVVRVAD
jgi:glutamate-1-semialdehyde 2,1-aminomutase